ncbi:ankyrin repeat-containing domain protein [Penicillium desertorum]|uniref:Ankyrin repeat-containing domain protein n=1 Tax=Penicillium desertorum TaxID=1303715 RepID=A0A9X0BKW6_9EURO|nr:ankyrin repeat-containing domain protein [Penicillium desertorum]
MERRLDELRREDGEIEIGAKSKWKDDMGSLEGISSPANSQGITPRNDRLGSSCYCRFGADETLGAQSSQPDFNQSDHGISQRSLRQRTHHEVYQIRSQHFNLFLGMLSVSILRKKNTESDSSKRRENSYAEIKLRFAPSWFICKAFIARLYASTTGGLNLSQSLATVHIVPRYEGIFVDVCCGEVAAVRKTFEERKASPNSADKYGHSLIAMAAGNSHLELVRYFLDLGVNTQIVDDNGR